MKTKILLTILYLATLATYILAQNPGFNYQAVLRDVQGEVMPNANITLFVSLSEGESGPVLYRENHALLTDELGILNTMIGSGTLESGDFSSIVGVQNLSIKLEADIPGEPDVVDIGFSNIGATPFALYGRDEDSDPDNEMQTLSLEGDSLKISGTPGVSLEGIKSPWESTNTGISFSDGFVGVDTIKFPEIVTSGRSVDERLSYQMHSGGIAGQFRDADGNVRFRSWQAYDGTWINYRDGASREKIQEEFERGQFLTATALKLAHIFADDQRSEICLGDEEGVTLLASNGTKSSTCQFSTGEDGVPTLSLTDDELTSLYTTKGADWGDQSLITGDGSLTINCSEASNNRWEYENFDDGSSCSYYSNDVKVYECGEIGNASGGTATFTNNVQTTYSGALGPGIETGLCATFNGSQISTTCTANNEGAGTVGTNGPNGSPNVQCTSIGGSPNNGAITVNNASGEPKAWVFVDAAGMGVIQADVKNFVTDHPTRENTKIVYASLEGPEAGAYDRGTSTLTDGEIFVSFAEHFQHVADPKSMTVMLTPLSADSKGLAVVEKTDLGFRIKELDQGRGNYSFDWEVKCKRKGFENYQVIREAVKMADSSIKPSDFKIQK